MSRTVRGVGRMQMGSHTFMASWSRGSACMASRWGDTHPRERDNNGTE